MPSLDSAPQPGHRPRVSAAARPQHIPWGYGQDRITAMVVDPDRLFVYWEVSDEAIEKARRSLGAGGPSAWLAVRAYDVTGRIFDGTNAHHYFDVRVSRTDRQWYVAVGRPDSTWCVELGLKSMEGYFARVARSGRADFPRRQAVGPGGVEWLTVRASGEIERPSTAHPPSGAPGGGGPSAPAASDAPTERPAAAEPAVAWTATWRVDGLEWLDGRGFAEWLGPIVRTWWEAGPFLVPVPVPQVVEEREEGGVTIQSIGDTTRIVHGPWRVVIRGLRGHAEGKVLATWRVHRSWTVEAGGQRWVSLQKREIRGSGPGGGSEELVAGASERLWRRGSELRLGGASEIHRAGASELLFGGASERLFRGASERRLGGGSELRLGGASERILRGGSEGRLER